MGVDSALKFIKKFFRKSAASSAGKRKNYLVIVAVNKPMRDVHLMIDLVGLPKIKSSRDGRNAGH